MKVQLSSEGGINTLKVDGAIDAHALGVLKAGVAKLLRDGKNKVIVDIEQVPDLPGELIKELAALNITAMGLEGIIILSGVTSDKKEAVAEFAKPNILHVFATTAQAIEEVNRATSPAEDNLDGSSMKVLILTKDKEIASLKERLAMVDPAEIKRLQEEAATAKARNEQVETELFKLIEERKTLMDAVVASDKIAQLEDAIQELTKKAQAQAK